MDVRVAYYLQGKDKTIYFTSEGLTYVLSERRAGEEIAEKTASVKERLLINPAERELQSRRDQRRFAVKLDFLGANADVRPSGEEKTGAVISYFKGKPEEWKAGLPTYSRIVYKNLWPGIDVAYYGTVDKMKYEFVVHPGSDPSLIRLAYRGVSAVEVNGEGRLEVRTPAGDFADDRPAGYQEINGDRVDVALRYLLEERSAKDAGPGGEEAVAKSYVYGFNVGAYDRTKPLVLDPAVLVYCGYIGGSDIDYGWGIAVDGAGNAYVTGNTLSTQATFPVVVGPDLTNNGSAEAFVAKVNASGTALVYCGYIGGSGIDNGYGIAVDGSGNAYVTGLTSSTEATFPVIGGPDLTYNGGTYDAFVAKVNASGTALVYCGYIGGSGYDNASGIAVDGSGNAYVTGYTPATEATFPVIGGPDLTYNGGTYDAYVAKVNASGTALVYCGYIGGSGRDYGLGIAVDGSGNAYVTGYTSSTEATFPVIGGPDLTYNGGTYDAYVTKVNASGTALVYCGYIGGSGSDLGGGSGIAVDVSGNAYVTGDTSSNEATFPVIGGPDLTYNGNTDAYVAKVNASGTALVYCGYIGGSGSDYGYNIAVDVSGNAYVTGDTFSTEATFPVIGGPDLTYNGGSNDAFVAKVNASGTALVYCGYIGGSGSDYGYNIAVDVSGNAYVTGNTSSNEATFPVLVGPDLTYNGGTYDAYVGDAFVAKIFCIDGSLGFRSSGSWTGAGKAVAGWFIGDFNGDGKKDIFRYYPGVSGADMFLSDGTQFNSVGSWTGAGYGSDGWYIGDFNGDGKDDIFRYYPGVSGADMFLSDGTQFNSVGSWTGAGNGSDGWYVGDFNGDGKDDIFRYYPGVSGADMFLSDGTQFNSVGSWTGAGNGSDGWYVGDFNGDGKDDIMRYTPGKGSEVFLSDGTQFVSAGIWTGAGNGADGWYVGDFNGDGKCDIFRYVPGVSGAEVFLSDGTKFVEAGSWTGAGNGTDGWYVGDFNGDGKADIFRYYPGVSGADVFLAGSVSGSVSEFDAFQWNASSSVGIPLDAAYWMEEKWLEPFRLKAGRGEPVSLMDLKQAYENATGEKPNRAVLLRWLKRHDFRLISKE
jgi:hypothetical protein